jgi:hypothetical protein
VRVLRRLRRGKGMIKRRYFESADVYDGEGNRISSSSKTACYTSWMPKPKFVLYDFRKRVADEYGVNIENVHVTAFNRI